METSKILNADVLDIIFDGRNKEYGAYALRKNYNKRLTTAMAGMGSVLLIFFVGSVLANAMTGKKPMLRDIPDVVHLTEIHSEKPPVVPPPPPPPIPAPPPQVRITAFVPPVIVPDVEVQDPPPTIDALEHSTIGIINRDGTDDVGIVAPPIENKGSGPIVAPTVQIQDYDKIFIKVENPAKFPGGFDGWKRYLEHNLQYPDAALEVGTQATVKVQLVVDKNGKVSAVKALNDPGNGLAEEAVRVIKKGPKWEPAEQNGMKVTFQFVQSITFTMN